MSTIFRAIRNILENPVIELKSTYSGRNTINNIGTALELYVQDAFAGTIQEQNLLQRNRVISSTFSYLGNQNNPPDIIIRGSDAIEVKKIQNIRSSIALNSSYPKHKLFSDDHRITESCRSCENEGWEEKDIIYAVGVTDDEILKRLLFVYGDCYAASRETYLRIGEKIKQDVLEVSDIEFAETKEIGRVNRVDPLGITNLRIRGMWHIENPFKVFQDVYAVNQNNSFSLGCIMRHEKYYDFPNEERHLLERQNAINVADIQIKNPNNPAQLLAVKLITFEVE